jgi:dynein heavy chain 1
MSVQTMASISPQRMARAPAERGRLHFLLAWFNAVALDRLRYTPLGWSNYYEFNAADQRCSFKCFDDWIDQVAQGRQNVDPDTLPWEALRTLLGQVFYGGRVDNLFDQRVLMGFLEQFFVPEIFDKGFSLTGSTASSAVDFLKVRLE